MSSRMPRTGSMKRITSYTMAVVVLTGLLPSAGAPLHAQTEETPSAEASTEKSADRPNEVEDRNESQEPVQREALSEEITVTARRLEEVLQDVPGTVSVLTDAQIEAVGVKRAEDFVKLVPGVSMVNAAEVGDTQVNIRGINGARDAENSFAFIVDGVLMTNPAAFNREFVNLQQIEVLKGPQGALYGRNAAAGAMIVTTTQPSRDQHRGQIKLSTAEDGTHLGSATVGGPIGEGGVTRYQVHGDWRTTDGFYSNSFLGRDDAVDDFESFNFGGRLLLEPGDQTLWDVKARYGEVEAAAITFNGSFHLPAFAQVLGVPQFFEDVNEHEFTFQGNIDPLNEQAALEISAKVDHTLSGAHLTGWILYSDIENSFTADGTSGAFGFFNTEPNCRQSVAELFGTGVTLPPPQFLGPTPEDSLFGPYTPTTCDGTQYQVRNQEDISGELRLTGRAGDRLRWQTGAYVLNIDREVGVNLGIDRGFGVVRELFVPQDGPNPTEQLVHDNFKTDVAAVFGSLFYDATENVELSLALRYDREDREVRNLVPTDARTQFVDFTLDGRFTGGAPLNPGLNPAVNPEGQIPDKSETFEEIQPKVSATWDVSDRTTLFGSWGVGFKSGGFNNQGSQATVNLFFNDVIGTDLVIQDQFDKETSSAFEVGFKSNLGRGVYLEGAAYRTDVDDMQFFEFLVGPFGLLRVVSNIDEVEIQGAEIGLNWSVSDHVTLWAGYSFTDSEIVKNSSRPATVGNESPYTPEYTGDLALDFSYPLSGRWVFTASTYLTFVGDTWFHTVQDETQVTLFDAVFPGLGTMDFSPTQRDSYELLDLRIGVTTGLWSITLVGTNLTDEEFLEEVIPAPEFGGSFLHPGTQRRVGLELSYRF